MIRQRANQWITTGEVGTSSKTIWAVLTGTISEQGRSCGINFDTPSDADDFSRCYKLLQLIPEWRTRLPEVAEVFPKWLPIVEMWDDLTILYEDKQWEGIYERLDAVRDRCMELDGWEKTGKGSYTRKKTTVQEQAA
ncbi:hypothetical protein H6F86_21130 [Phormidium sp. FACHB-592]|uniref:Uncharacterized protein n=1 Tax=Stenomitos frigidus AS-A4 TaxID=2933935 RepID=A0ABV0KES9_9CYAN|nr:hypothetical protein [Phormidium sp. FACHB-592]MBD2076339.1 hypothetical protein [Phormidium sp. FACHB-592]